MAGTDRGKWNADQSQIAALMATPMVLALGAVGVTAASAGTTYSLQAVHSEGSARVAAVNANLVSSISPSRTCRTTHT
jgi:hypothetical protein